MPKEPIGKRKKNYLTELEDRANVYFQLFTAARLSFDQRRTYQLKIGLAIWAAVLTLILALVKKADIGLETGGMWALASAGWIALVIHVLFLWYGQKACKVDQKKAEYYEKLLKKTAGVSSDHWKEVEEDWKEVEEAIKAVKRFPGSGRWVELAHFLITGVLVATLTVLLLRPDVVTPAC